VVAYSFKARFAEPILAGTKGGTIRAARRRHARPGEELQLYTGMRTKQCRLITRKTCVEVEPIELDFYLRKILLGDGIERMETIAGRLVNSFAWFDGFADFDEMAEWWEVGRGRLSSDRDSFVFCGLHIRWLPLSTIAAA
jgi:hypothetical protein